MSTSTSTSHDGTTGHADAEGHAAPPLLALGASVGAAPPARVVETHVSVLFFYQHRVFKFRRPVAYGFVDFTDRDRRWADCEREVDLNRRLAPDVYLGTATLSMNGQEVDHAVVMRRLPDERSLAALVRAGAPVDDEVRRIAGTLAAFHARASRSPAISATATPTALWQRWQATAEEVGRFVGPVLDPDRYRELTALAGRFLRGRGPLLAQRIAEGAVCDGHGDLQASDVFCLDDGPRMLDCLEFDDELRYGDVLADVAFLAADLDRLGATSAAALLLDEYRQRSGRDQPAALVHFYVAYRAHIRVLVECLRAEQTGAPATEVPSRLLELALGHLRVAVPKLVLVGGPPGSGKSTLAGWIGDELGAEVLSSDHRRRVEAAAETLPDEGRYGDAGRARVYDWMCEAAATLLGMGRSVVLDATWSSVDWRSSAVAVARATEAQLIEIRCECTAPQRRERVAGRLPEGEGESEATPEISDALAASEDPWPSAQVIDTSGPIEVSCRAVRTAVSGQADVAP